MMVNYKTAKALNRTASSQAIRYIRTLYIDILPDSSSQTHSSSAETSKQSLRCHFAVEITPSKTYLVSHRHTRNQREIIVPAESNSKGDFLTGGFCVVLTILQTYTQPPALPGSRNGKTEFDLLWHWITLVLNETQIFSAEGATVPYSNRINSAKMFNQSERKSY